MPNPLISIIELIKKSGDNCIVLDIEGNPAFVVVKFEDYQKMRAGKTDISALTEEQLLNKVNADIAAWKASHEDEECDNWPSIEPMSVIKEKEDKKSVNNDEIGLNQAKISHDVEKTEDKYYFEPID